MRAQLAGSVCVWKQVVALPLCVCLLASCSMRTVRVQNPVLSVGSSETERLRDLLSGKRIDASFTDGTRLEGRVKEIQEGLLRVDIKKTSDPNSVPRGLQDLPHGSDLYREIHPVPRGRENPSRNLVYSGRNTSNSGLGRWRQHQRVAWGLGRNGDIGLPVGERER